MNAMSNPDNGHPEGTHTGSTRGRSRNRGEEEKRRKDSKSRGPKAQERGKGTNDTGNRKAMSSLVKAKTMKRATKSGAPIKSPTRKNAKYKYNLRTGNSGGSKGSGRGKRGQQSPRIASTPRRNLSDRLVSMASGAVEMLLGATQEESTEKEVKIKQEMIQESERYNQTWEQAQESTLNEEGKEQRDPGKAGGKEGEDK